MLLAEFSEMLLDDASAYDCGWVLVPLLQQVTSHFQEIVKQFGTDDFLHGFQQSLQIGCQQRSQDSCCVMMRVKSGGKGISSA